MTEDKIKELAREYIDNCTERAGFVILTEGIKRDFVDLFVAGFMKCLELNKGVKWHKVAEELPPLWKGLRQTSIRIVDNYDRIIIYDYGSEKWRDLEGESLGIQPDYWCEIPQFKHD